MNVIIAKEIYKIFRGAYNYNDIFKIGTEGGLKNIKNNQNLIKADDPTIIQFTSVSFSVS